MKKLQILQVAPPWINIPPKNYGGTEWVIHNLTEGLVRNGHQVTLFATKASQTSAKLKYVFDTALRDQDIPWEASLPAMLHYDQALKHADRYDLIHFHLSSQTDITMLPYIAKLKTPHIVTNHGHWPYDVFSQMDTLYNKYYGKYVRMVSISKFMQSCLPSYFKSVGYAYNPIDTTLYEFNHKPQDYFAWLGRIVPAKGLHLAIQAVKATGNKLVFAGVYNQYMKEERDYFEQLIKPQIDNQQITFLGPADLKAKNQLLKNAIALLNPIEWNEPFGMVMVESMACGTPVISYQRGAASELIINQKTGYLVSNLQEMIIKMNDVPKLSRLYTRIHVENNFSIQQAVDKYQEIYSAQIVKHDAVSKLTLQSIRPEFHIGY